MRGWKKCGSPKVAPRTAAQSSAQARSGPSAPAQAVEERQPARAPEAFEFAAEHPQAEHVEGRMSQPGMQEGVAAELPRHEQPGARRPQREPACDRVAQHPLEQEHRHVGDDQGLGQRRQDVLRCRDEVACFDWSDSIGMFIEASWCRRSPVFRGQGRRSGGSGHHVVTRRACLWALRPASRGRPSTLISINTRSRRDLHHHGAMACGSGPAVPHS